MDADTSSPAGSGGFAATLNNLLNKGVDVAAQLAAAKLNQPKNTGVVGPTTSANAASQAAAAGSSSATTAPASKLPAWVIPSAIVAGVLALVGILFAAFRSK